MSDSKGMNFPGNNTSKQFPRQATRPVGVQLKSLGKFWEAERIRQDRSCKKVRFQHGIFAPGLPGNDDSCRDSVGECGSIWQSLLNHRCWPNFRMADHTDEGPAADSQKRL